jgi:hypothetical protein
MKARQGGRLSIRLLTAALTLFLFIAVAACQQRDLAPSEAAEALPTIPAIPPSPIESASSVDTPRHFANCAFRTGQNAIIGIPADVGLIGDLVLEPGDEIAVMAADDTVCAGAAVWSGANIALTAWGDDSQTEAVDGLLEGELLQFRLWDASENQELDISQVTYREGSDRYQVDGIYIVESMELATP